MEETELEQIVGDILVRKRKISSLLYESCESVAYGPLNLQVTEDDTVIATDFDGRVYPTVKLLDTEDSEEQINHLVTEIDACVEQHQNEL